MKKTIVKRNINFITDNSEKVCCYCGLKGNLLVDCNWSFKKGEGFERYYHRECENRYRNANGGKE